ncbi:MarR family transcriptional regulator [Streptomyces sp. JJ66]|uniref:MarR family winged helix-turn-helix transcriptional regulator n=1 Tax=Streptomyces sp. JJ66 TaxID=2803843 RepID=UPI001C59C335|nr:MarR family transcriptional regulator [Streptomyces sp. JJ66]MBW1601905.1 MarR family transcriptional regulator [Streptomyces sp. JJ66]
MPTHPDLTTDSVPPSRPAPGAPASPDRNSGPPTAERSEGEGVFEAMQHQVALFARRAEQTRLGGVGQGRNSMDRAAYLLLNRLDQKGPMGVKALAEGMGIDSSTVTRQVAPLVESGLVERASHPEDGRAVVLALSARGASRLAQVRASRRALMALLTQEWDDEERTVFCTLLTRFNEALSAVHSPAHGS